MARFHLFGRRRAPRVGEDRIFLVQNAAALAILEKPKARVIGPVSTPTCSFCGKPLAERVSATASSRIRDRSSRRRLRRSVGRARGRRRISERATRTGGLRG
jgi:hypothetical protein